jgi:hypothetical protein
MALPETPPGDESTAPATDAWTPLQFWFNQDAQLSLPIALMWDTSEGRFEYVDFTGTACIPGLRRTLG